MEWSRRACSAVPLQGTLSTGEPPCLTMCQCQVPGDALVPLHIAICKRLSFLTAPEMPLQQLGMRMLHMCMICGLADVR